MKILTIIFVVFSAINAQEENAAIPWWYVMGRPIAITAIRSPFDAITQNQQVHNTSIRQTTRTLAQEGLATFYRGAMPRFVSEGCRSVYMIPLWSYSQTIFHDHNPEFSRNYPYLRKIFAGCAFGLAETVIGTPMSRISVLLNTQRAVFSLSSLRSFSYKDYYRGAGLTFVNSSFGCSIYLMANYMYRQIVQNSHQGALLRPYDYVTAGLITAFIYSSVTAPLLTLSIRIQHALPGQHLNVVTIVRTLIAKGGLSSFYAGWTLRFMQLGIVAAIESVFMEQVDRRLK